MIYHVLNGDGLAENFNLEGEKIVCRECLIDGDLKAKNINELWKVRAEYIKKTYDADDYFEKVKGEFDKLNNLKPTDEVNLWFGNEAFCQVNMSFVLWMFWDKKPDFYRVFPDSDGWNCNYSNVNQCFENRKKLSWEEVQWGTLLWEKFQAKDLDCSLFQIVRFENLKNFEQVCRALTKIEIEPKEILREITRNGETDFNKIFVQFKEKAGVYGFGDLQVKNLLSEI